MKFVDELKFRKLIGFSLKIWKKNTQFKKEKSDLIYGNSDFKNSLHVLVSNNWDIKTEMISTSDKLLFIEDPKIFNFHTCENSECSYVTDKVSHLKAHHIALKKNRIYCKETKMGEYVGVYDEMINEGIIPIGFRQMHALFWDIESVLVKSEAGLCHVPVSIAAYRTFGQIHKFFFSRKTMNPKDLKIMIEKFVNFLEESENIYQNTIPNDIKKNKFIIYKMLKDHSEGTKFLNPSDVAKYRRYVYKLNEITSMKMYSYYGQRYDINVLKGCLFDTLLRRDPKFTCIKRGSQIMQFQFNNIISRDIGVGLKKNLIKC